MVVPPLPDLTTLSHAQKDALIVSLWEQVVLLTARTALEQRLNEPAKTPDNSVPSKGPKPNQSASKTAGPRKGSLGRKGGGRSPDDQVVSAGGLPAGKRHHHLRHEIDRQL